MPLPLTFRLLETSPRSRPRRASPRPPAAAPSGQEPCQPRLPSPLWLPRPGVSGAGSAEERGCPVPPQAPGPGTPSRGQEGSCGQDVNSLLGPRGPALWPVASLLGRAPVTALVTGTLPRRLRGEREAEAQRERGKLRPCPSGALNKPLSLKGNHRRAAPGPAEYSSHTHRVLKVTEPVL